MRDLFSSRPDQARINRAVEQRDDSRQRLLGLLKPTEGGGRAQAAQKAARALSVVAEAQSAFEQAQAMPAAEKVTPDQLSALFVSLKQGKAVRELSASVRQWAAAFSDSFERPLSVSGTDEPEPQPGDGDAASVAQQALSAHIQRATAELSAVAEQLGRLAATVMPRGNAAALAPAAAADCEQLRACLQEEEAAVAETQAKGDAYKEAYQQQKIKRRKLKRLEMDLKDAREDRCEDLSSFEAKIAQAEQEVKASEQEPRALAEALRSLLPLVPELGFRFRELHPLQSSDTLSLVQVKKLEEDFTERSELSDGRYKVFKAKDRDTDRVVVLKGFGYEIDDERKALRRALRVFQTVSHPYVLSLDCIVHDPSSSLFYFQFDHMRHGSLADVLAQKPCPLTLQQKASTARETALALAHLHQMGVLHRDIKAANVLVPAYGRAVLCDFETSKTVSRASAGAARFTTVAATTMVVKTVGYASPEVVFGAPNSMASDVFSLGAVVHEIFAGELPARSLGTRWVQGACFGLCLAFFLASLLHEGADGFT